MSGWLVLPAGFADPQTRRRCKGDVRCARCGAWQRPAGMATHHAGHRCAARVETTAAVARGLALCGNPACATLLRARGFTVESLWSLPYYARKAWSPRGAVLVANSPCPSWVPLERWLIVRKRWLADLAADEEACRRMGEKDEFEVLLLLCESAEETAPPPPAEAANG